jgi:hypothetical protein
VSRPDAKPTLEFLCYDCKQHTHDWYMVKDAVWCLAFPEYRQLKMSFIKCMPKAQRPRIYLCFECLERRLGRPLALDDFRLELGINAGVVQGIKIGLRSKGTPMGKAEFHVGDEVRITAKDCHEHGKVGMLEQRFAESHSHWYVRTDNGRGIYPTSAFELVPRCPWRLAIKTIVGKEPPDWVRGNLHKLSDARHGELQDWIGSNLQVSMEWSTAIGVIDAACNLVDEAKNNSNFKTYYPGYAVEEAD